MPVKKYDGTNWVTVAGDGAQGPTGPAGASATTVVTTKGDLLGYSTTAARLAVGTNGQVLTADSAEATGLKWAPSGKVLQVVQATSTTQTSTNGQTYVDTNLSASITPSATTSKILVMTYQPYLLYRASTSDANASIQLVRGSTAILAPATGQANFEYASDSYFTIPVNVCYLDSPSTTSSTTYKTQMKSGSTSHTIFAQVSSTTSVMILMEIGA